MKQIILLFVISFYVTNSIAQSHVIEVHPNNRVASLLMAPAEYSNWINNDEFNNGSIRKALIQDIYEKFQDDFDFIFLILNENDRPSNLPFGQLIQVSNAVQGIGKNIFDNSSQYGSSGKLKAVMHLTKRTYLRSGPSLHEIMHNWANSAIYTESVSTSGTNLNSFAYRPHWGFTGGSNKGQLGGFNQSDLIENGGDSYTVPSFGPNANGGNSVPYTELELYLMGLIPISDVSDFDVFTNITSLAVDGDNYDFTATTRTTYTPSSIETLLGQRIPSHIDSQKDFRLLVMILTDTPLTDGQWNTVDDHSEKFARNGSDGSGSNNFWEATNGLATIDTSNLETSLSSSNFETEGTIRLYPSITSNHLYLNSDNSDFIKSVTIYNSIGQQVYFSSFLYNMNSTQINVHNFKEGIYFLSVRTSSSKLVRKKFMVSKSATHNFEGENHCILPFK